MAKAYTKTEWKDHVVDNQSGKVLQQGTPVSASKLNNMEDGIDLAHQKLEGASRQTVPLTHGLQVINGDVNAPVSLQLEGRTLVPLQNTQLDAAKYYILADKKTKIKLSESFSVKGITKFPGVNAKVQGITRTANFENKVAGSTLENPHITKHLTGGQTTLKSPADFTTESAGDTYTKLSYLDGDVSILQRSGVDEIAQRLWCFDIIEEIERNIGRIPRNTKAEKIQWAKDNIARLSAAIYAYGSGPQGNKATTVRWAAGNSSWNGTRSVTTANTVAKMSVSTVTASDELGSDGFWYIVTYADPSDGITPSTVYVDYPEIEIELKEGAELLAPRIPLYEVTKEEYDKILVIWNENEVIRRYPAVEGVQHVQNPYIMAEGGTLVPPFTDSEWSMNQKAVIESSYKVKLVDAVNGDQIRYKMKVIPNTNYAISAKLTSDSDNFRLYVGPSSTGYNGQLAQLSKSSQNTTFNSGNNTDLFVVLHASAPGTYTWEDIMLTLGDTPKPFEPKNPSYLFADVKVGKIESFKDTLFEQDGKMMIRKVIEKDVVLDGSLPWTVGTDYIGYKEARLAVTGAVQDRCVVSKYNGTILRSEVNATSGDSQSINSTTNILYIRLWDYETGFSDTYIPTAEELKAHFNGWKVKVADSNGKPTAWKSIIDGTDAPTQTLAYVSTNKAPGYIPYKLSYVLATPQVSEVKTEGSISLNGPTQIEVGSGIIIREKIIPFWDSNYSVWRINSASTTAYLKYRTEKIINVYKGNQKLPVVIATYNAYGKQRAAIQPEDYDENAEYYVTYILYDRNQFTTNVLTASATFATNIRTALDDTVKKLEDVKAETSINSLLLYEMLVRMKAGGI
jgi:hypothetical protein